MYFPKQRPAGLRGGVDAVHDKADVPVIVLALGSFREGADVRERERVQLQQLSELVYLLWCRIVKVEPEELVTLQVAGNVVQPGAIQAQDFLVHGDEPKA